ncbi:MAG: ribonuclease D [Alphaproteobacteria bacterium]|nr:ribonuclease D [Alphaproteobacteria bacterium]
MYDDTPLVMIEDEEQLAQACEAWKGESVLGVDTESDSMYSYREKVCLIQVSDTQKDYIIDPLRVSDLSALGVLMEDPGIVKIFHGADYDIVSLKRDFGFTFRNIFDTMVAAQMLGLPKVGLADVAKRYFTVELDKKYQTHDWSKRPLQPEHLEYARGDTHFLAALREVLMLKLERKGRLEIVLEECKLLEEREWTATTDELAWLRVKGVRRFTDDQLRVVREVYQLRDGHAQELDRPSYKVFPDQIIQKLATVQPANVEELHRLGRPSSSMFRRYGKEMLEAVQRGLADDSPIPEMPPRKRKTAPSSFGSRETERFITQLKAWRDRVKKRDKVPYAMIASNAQLAAIAGTRPGSVEGLRELEDLRDWQVRLYGEELLAEIKKYESQLDEQGGSKRRRRRRRRNGAS